MASIALCFALRVNFLFCCSRANIDILNITVYCEHSVFANSFCQ